MLSCMPVCMASRSQCVSAMTQGFRESKLLVCKVEPRWLHVHASITNIDILFDAMDRKLDHNTMIFVDYAYDLMKILRNNHHLMDSIWYNWEHTLLIQPKRCFERMMCIHEPFPQNAGTNMWNCDSMLDRGIGKCNRGPSFGLDIHRFKNA